MFSYRAKHDTVRSFTFNILQGGATKLNFNCFPKSYFGFNSLVLPKNTSLGSRDIQRVRKEGLKRYKSYHVTEHARRLYIIQLWPEINYLVDVNILSE